MCEWYLDDFNDGSINGCWQYVLSKMSHDTSKRLMTRYNKSLKFSFSVMNWAPSVCYTPLEDIGAEGEGSSALSVELEPNFDSAALIGGRMIHH